MTLIWLMTILLIECLIIIIQSKRLFVFEHFRHGARGPLKKLDQNYEDIFKEKWNGIGELSSVGLRMLYLLGIKNKKRYSDFIQPVFDTNEILLYSTNINRTIDSINAYMQGLYSKPTKIILDQNQIDVAYPQLINKKTLEPAIKQLEKNILPNQMTISPIHIFNPFERTFLLNDEKICPGIVKHKQANVESSAMKKVLDELYNKFESLFGSKLREYFKITDPKYYYNRENIYSLSDTVIADITDVRSIKDFKDTQIDLEGLYSISQEVTYIDAYQLEFNSKNNTLSIMSMSPTFDSIISWMEKRINKDKAGKDHEIHGSEPRMVVYSGHDSTMATMHLFMEEVFKIKIDHHSFATNQHFELIENDQQYSVEYYSNDEKRIDIPFDEFKSKIMNVIWTKEEINAFCDDEGKRIDPFMISSIVLGLIAVILIIALVVLICLKNRKKEALLTQVEQITALI